MDLAPRTSLCLLSLTGWFYKNPPGQWVSRDSFEKGVEHAREGCNLLLDVFYGLVTVLS